MVRRCFAWNSSLLNSAGGTHPEDTTHEVLEATGRGVLQAGDVSQT